MKKVFVSQQLPAEGLRELVKKTEVIIPEKTHNYFDLEEDTLKNMEAILPTYAFKVTREVMDISPSLKIIANLGAGYDNIDVKYAASRGILVTNSPDPVVEPTAEHAFALLLAAARKVCENDRKIRTEPDFRIKAMENLGVGLYGKTLGIIGMGNIGRAVARRALAFGMNIVYYNRKRVEEEIESRYHVRYMELEELLRRADFISLHAPATPETYHLINEESLKLMKENAIVVNTARGGLVDEEALAAALESKRILGAALDVFESEPAIPEYLKRIENLVLSPHNGTGTRDARIAMTRFAAQNILNFFEGKALLSPVY
ncbi:MAG: NAD(P)-binding domain-containing protein [Bacteroides sp.]|nr:NAD(P)-binding domain-containing protein [Bacteroides sp.]